ncbi:transposase [Alicyclobacillus hesperidum]|uniref:transposase n=1 Tax=Alicyclobacillus hesperidum TaxID=89784 RepID=UPI003B437FCD
MLEAELDTHLGYAKHDTKNKTTDNSRNGHSRKTLASEYGDVEISVPRDRKGEFEPEIIKKNQTNTVGIEEQVIALYARGGEHQRHSSPPSSTLRGGHITHTPLKHHGQAPSDD